MTFKQKAAAGIGATMVSVAMCLGLHAPAEVKEAHKIPKDRIDAMVFPKGLKMLGDRDGILCHQIVGPDGKPWKFHRIEGKDVRKMTEAEIEAMIIADTQADLEGEGVACSTVEPGIFPAAFADVKRCDECGTDCWITSCPAHVGTPYCQLEGTNCVISFICCGGHACPASCET